MAEGYEFAANENVIGRTALNNTRAYIPNTLQEPSWKPHHLLSKFHSIVAIPIHIDGETLGILNVMDRQIDSLADDEINLLETISGQIAIALRNMFAYKEAQGKVMQDEMLREVVFQIRETKDVETALQVAAQAIGNALQAKQTVVQLESLIGENGKVAKGGISYK